MQKIMFNDELRLTQAVLDGRKTMTRRIEKSPRYKVGEEVAIAQCYADIADYLPQDLLGNLKSTKGWNNKMFVRADLMPRRIKIINLYSERLQDICYVDCIDEGVMYRPSVRGYIVEGIHLSRAKHMLMVFVTAKAAFAALIKRISGKRIWDSNPLVSVYQFELVKKL